ncbi:MAG: peptidoglycan-binding domain-containing protein, partial [Pseudomonadota bacterium]
PSARHAARLIGYTRLANHAGPSQALAMETTGVDAPLLPPEAKPGECYARVFVAPKYATRTEEVLKTAASSRIETTPATFEWVEERVLVKEATSRLEVVPATYGWETEEILVKPASSKLVPVPAVYETQTERLLVKPEHTVWKKGTNSGSITRIDDTTGEIMCLVTVPAEYRTVSKRVMVSAATTKEVGIPAEYKTVKRKVQKTAPTTRTVEIPAEYKTVKVRKMVNPAGSRTIDIPATYQTVTKREQVADGYLEWRSILCDTNATPAVVRSLQTALTREGIYQGPIDGIIGSATAAAVRTYQQRNGLATGGITMATLKKLNVAI